MVFLPHPLGEADRRLWGLRSLERVRRCHQSAPDRLLFVSNLLRNPPIQQSALHRPRGVEELHVTLQQSDLKEQQTVLRKFSVARSVVSHWRLAAASTPSASASPPTPVRLRRCLQRVQAAARLPAEGYHGPLALLAEAVSQPHELWAALLARGCGQLAPGSAPRRRVGGKTPHRARHRQHLFAAPLCERLPRPAGWTRPRASWTSSVASRSPARTATPRSSSATCSASAAPGPAFRV